MRILHDDWSVRSGENRSDQDLQHLAAMLFYVLAGSKDNSSLLPVWLTKAVLNTRYDMRHHTCHTKAPEQVKSTSIYETLYMEQK